MRRILVEAARRKQRIKHGGDRKRVGLTDVDPPSPQRPKELLAVDDVLDRLAQVDPL
jgi:hypothetical protein